MAFKLSDTHYTILAAALERFGDQAHERATELHASGYTAAAEAQEDLSCDTRELAASFAQLQRLGLKIGEQS